MTSLKGISLLLLSIFLHSSLLFSQSEDEFRSKMDTASSREIKFGILQQFGQNTVHTDTDKALEIADESIALAEEIGKDSILAIAYNFKGVCFNVKGDIPNSLDFYEKSLALTNPKDSLRIAILKVNMGLGYAQLEDNEKALELYYSSLFVFEALDFKRGVAVSLGNIEIALDDLGEDSLSLVYNMISFELKEELKDSIGMGITMFNRASKFKEINDLENARESAMIALKISEAVENNSVISRVYHLLGNISRDESNYDQAISYYLRSAEAGKALGSQPHVDAYKISLSELYYLQGNYKEALYWGEKSLESSKNTPMVKDIIQSYVALAKATDKLKYWERSSFYKDSIIHYRRKQFDLSTAQKMSELESKYQLTERQQENERLETENEQKAELIDLQNYLIVASSLGLIILLILALVWYHAKHKQTKLNQQLVNTQDQLVQAEKMASLGMLTAGVAHEINNPINYVSSGADGLNMNLEDLEKLIQQYELTISSKNSEEELKKLNELKTTLNLKELLALSYETIADIKEGSHRVSEIVEGLRAMSQAGKSPRSEVDIHEVIDTSLRLLKPRFNEHIKVVKKYGNIPYGMVNKGEIAQVFMNVLINAAQAVDEKGGKGVLEIQSMQNGTMLEFKVIDNGIGMNAKTLKHLFDPFYTTKEVGKGQGLGMSTSLGIVEAHGGKIEVASKEGEGSQFTILLPT